MGRESFEDSLKKKFDGKSVKAPASVWNEIENDLNASLVQDYESKKSIYKWSAAAAIFIAFISLAFQLVPDFLKYTDKNDAEVYNALLHPDNTHLDFLDPLLNSSYSTRLYPVLIQKGASGDKNYKSAALVYEEEVGESIRIENSYALNRKGNRDTELAYVEYEIYPYRKAGYFSKPTSRDEADGKLWAGVEAGAGNFNSSISGSDVFAGGINQSSLANVLGADEFVNPTTAVDPEMNSGIAKSIEVGFGIKLGKKWALETGVSYTNVESTGDASINVLDIYTIDNSDFIGPSGGSGFPVPSASRETSIEVRDDYDYDVGIRSNVQFTSIPMQAGYFLVDKKMSLRLNVGLAANYFVGSQIKDSDQNIINSSANNLYNDWSFDGLGGIELGYSIFNRFDVTLEPNYRHNLTPLSNSSNATNSRFVIQTGVRYVLQ